MGTTDSSSPIVGSRPLFITTGSRGDVQPFLALARALAVEPRVLLLDEPFGALDAQVRKELRRWLRRMHDEMNITSVFVTHDQDEAMEVADRVVVLNRGRVEQVGTPDEVYDRPATPFVLKFLGDVNLFRGHFHAVHAPGQQAEGTTADENTVYVRPHEIEVVDEPAADTLAVERGRAIVPVTGEARNVGHQGVARARQAVEQGGLAHVGPPHQRDNRYRWIHGQRSAMAAIVPSWVCT